MDAKTPAEFPSTSLTLIRGIQQGEEASLARLCQTYWYPLYAYARRWGRRAEDAEDATQGFLSQLLEKRQMVESCSPIKSLRGFLLTRFKSFLVDESRREQAIKRGGRAVHLSLSFDPEDAERRYVAEPRHDVTPEKLYERAWANAFIQNCLAQVRETFVQGDKADIFEALEPFLAGPTSKEDGSLLDVAKRFGKSHEWARTSVSRMRKSFRKAITQAIADLVAEEADREEELRHLFGALQG